MNSWNVVKSNWEVRETFATDDRCDEVEASILIRFVIEVERTIEFFHFWEVSTVIMIVEFIILSDLLIIHVVAFSLFSFSQRSALEGIDVSRLTWLTHLHAQEEAVDIKSHTITWFVELTDNIVVWKTIEVQLKWSLNQLVKIQSLKMIDQCDFETEVSSIYCATST